MRPKENQVADRSLPPESHVNRAPLETGKAAFEAPVGRLDEIFQAANRSDAPGLVVGVAIGGRPIYRRGFGLASVQHGVANALATRMRIASISKHFTSLACLLLVEDGKLDIDAPASRYLPELPILQGMPSLRHFMAHTSGYRCTLELGSLANGLALQPKGWQLKALVRQTGVNFAPNQGQIYCNGTYHALSIVIERVTGIPFEQFLKERIFAPLGMHDTESVPNDAHMIPGLASPHIPVDGGGGWERPPSDSEIRGDGGIVSTVDDMLRWLAHLRGPKIIGTEGTWRQMLEPVKLGNGFQSVYSLGLKRHAFRGVEVIHHSGGLFGLNAQMLTVPQYGLDVVIMINGAPLSATELSRNVMDTVLGDRLLPARQLASAEEFRHVVGNRYRGKSGLTIGFEQLDTKLTVSLDNLGAAPVLYDEGTSLRVGFEDVGLGPYVLQKAALTPRPNGDPPDPLEMEVAGEIEVLERLPTKPPLKSDVATSLVGRYRCNDLAAEASITTDEGLSLYIRGEYSAARRLELAVYSKTDLGAAEIPPAVGRYALSVDLQGEKASGFWIDTIRARRVRFDRIPD